MATADILQEVETKAQRAKQAAYLLGRVSTRVKNQALQAMGQALDKNRQFILKANQKDIEFSKEKGLSEALIDRLLLNEARINGMISGLQQVASLPDPVGEIIAGWKRPNGIEIRKVRVPLGVIGIIYEARPNVTVDAAGLCLKAGNAVILRGGSEAINSNIAIVKVISEAASENGLPEGCIELIETTDRKAATHLMRLNQYVDVLIPRGGAKLIRTVMETATVPVIETGVGNCHVYVDESADLKMAEEIVFNAKVQRPGVCNAMETLLVHERIAVEFLPQVFERLMEAGVELRGCEKTQAIAPYVGEATEEDWYTEYLALILAVKVVESLDEAIGHINKYGSKHSEAIVTNDYQHAKRFAEEVDASCVYVNASTRLTDGGEFGFGAEIGISTQKLHARGPMALQELTSYKYVILGDGQIRT